jgi:DNA-directed RNA polymerase specialized sigma24 family protein
LIPVSQAFIDAYESYVWDVYGFLAYRTRSHAEAEDLTQETFERALRAWETFDPARGQPKAWLLAIARNAFIDSRRRRSSRPRPVAPEGMEELPADEGRGPVLGPEPKLADAIGRLGRREREAVALRFGGDLRTAEIAELLGITVANAQQILSRALRRLRSLLEEADRASEPLERESDEA